MSRKSATIFTIAAFLALPLAACDDGPTALGTTGTTSVQLTGSSSGASASLISFSQHGEAGGGNVSLDMVSSIDVTLTSVEALRLQEDGEAQWTALEVDDQELNLLDLPEGGVEVARGELEAGDYCNVRFFVGDATVTFSEDATLGGGPNPVRTFEAGEPHDLFIPSAENTGIKVPTARFSVEGEQETVTVAFEAGESVQTVNVTGAGVLMTPVLTAEEGADIPECDDVDDDENGDENGENGEENGDDGENGEDGENGGEE